MRGFLGERAHEGHGGVGRVTAQVLGGSGDSIDKLVIHVTQIFVRFGPPKKAISNVCGFFNLCVALHGGVAILTAVSKTEIAQIQCIICIVYIYNKDSHTSM